MQTELRRPVVETAEKTLELGITPPAKPIPSTHAARRAGVRRWRRVAILTGAVVLVVVAVAGLTSRRPNRTTDDIQLYKVTRRSFPVILQEKGELKAANSIDVRSELEGRSTIIFLVAEGTQVKKGDLIVELASENIDEKIRDVEIKETLAKAALEASEKELLILRDKNASEIRKAELTKWLAEHDVKKYQEGQAVLLQQDNSLAVEKAKYVVRRTQEQLKDSEQLYSQQYLTRMELENDRFNNYQAKIELEKAELAAKVANEFTIPMGLQERESAVREAEKDLDRQRKSAAASEAKAMTEVEAKKSEFSLTQEKLEKFRAQKAKSRIVATTDGLVVYAKDDYFGNSDNQIKTGTQVHERQLLIQLPDTSQMKVVIRVHEAKTEYLRVGLPATVEIEGFSEQRYTGKVSKIAVLADSRNRWFNPNLKEYETEILLDGQFTNLKPGNTAQVQVLVAELSDVLAVPVQSIFGKGNKYYVFVDDGEDVRPCEVEVGQASAELAEIRNGLRDGQSVRLAVTEDLKLKLPDDPGGSSTDQPAKPKKKLPPVTSQLTSQPTSQPALGSATTKPSAAPSTQPKS